MLEKEVFNPGITESEQDRDMKASSQFSKNSEQQ